MKNENIRFSAIDFPHVLFIKISKIYIYDIAALEAAKIQIYVKLTSSNQVTFLFLLMLYVYKSIKPHC